MAAPLDAPDVFADLRAFAASARERETRVHDGPDPIDAPLALLRRHGLAALLAAARGAAASGDEARVAVAAAALDGPFGLLASRSVAAALDVDATAGRALLGALAEATRAPQAEVRALAVRAFRRLAATGSGTGALSLRSLCGAGASAGAGADAMQLEGDGGEEDDNGSGEGSEHRLARLGLLGAVVARLADPETGVAEHAAEALCALAARSAVGDGDGGPAAASVASTASASAAAAPSTRVSLALAAFASSGRVARDASGIVAVRVHALCARLCGLGAGPQAACEAVGLVRALLDAASDAAGEDPLLQAAVIELLPPLAATRRGLAALRDSGLAARLAAWAGGAPGTAGAGAEGEPDPFLGQAALAALADLYEQAFEHAGPEGAEEAGAGAGADAAGLAWLRASVQPAVLAAVQQRLTTAAQGDGDGEAEASVAAALGALSSVLASDALAAGVMLDPSSTSTLLTAWLACGRRGVGSATEVSRLACFASLARVLHGAPRALARLPAVARPPALSHYQALFDRFGPSWRAGQSPGQGQGLDTAALLMQTLRDGSAPRARLAAFDLLSAAAALGGSWGVQRVLGGQGVLAFLLDRDSESTKEGREWKHGVVVSLLRNEACAATLGAESEALAQLRRERERGPHLPPLAGAMVADPVIRGGA